jgi:NAD(P)-dependent dehydrogenase (short-subunit alcohol dehydrogenase family)
MTSSSPLVILITGANAGIGYHTAHQIAKTGKYTVLVGARSTEKANDAIKSIRADDSSVSEASLVPLVIDLNKDDTISAAAKHVESTYGHLDILINNAAVPGTNSGNTRREKMNATFDTNVTGTAVVTDAFIPLILKSASPTRRIINVGSGLGSIEYISKGVAPFVAKYQEYSVSKAALHMLTWYTLKQLEGDKVAVLVASPGYCATNLNGFSGPRSAADGAAFIVDAAIKGSNEEVTGKFYESGQEGLW